MTADALRDATPQRILAVTRLLLTEVVHAMGHPEVLELREDGALFNPPDDRREGAGRHGVEIA